MKLYIGLKVRLISAPKRVGDEPIYPVKNPVPIGHEGVVADVSYYPKGTPIRGGGTLNHDSDCAVDFGVYGRRRSSSSRLEPILPSGHTAGHEGVCEELDKLLAGVVA